MIVVGVGYPTDDMAEIHRLRRRDFLLKQTEEDESVVTEGHGKPIVPGDLPDFISFFHEDLKFEVFDGEIHFSSPMLSALNGLRFVFGPL